VRENPVGTGYVSISKDLFSSACTPSCYIPYFSGGYSKCVYQEFVYA